MQTISRPQPGDYAPYASTYVDLVPEDGRVFDYLEQNLEAVRSLVQSLPEAKLDTPFAPGEWTVKEILVHMMDTERIFAYRGLRIARNDVTALPGFDQDDYVPYSGANERNLASIVEEYAAVRAANVALFKNLPKDAWNHAGTASGHRMTVNAAIYQIVGHELHHLNSIRQNYA